MKTTERIQRRNETHFRTATSRGIAGEASGVDREAGVIRGFSVITAGEARGHGMLIDDVTLDQVVEHGNVWKSGLKSRFGHPNMSNDAVGTYLGRARNFRRDGNQVRADMHFDPSAYETPNGDLASYVMKLGETDPGAFATSIIFSGHKQEQDGDDPDALPRARVEKLWAVDVVDEGAANSGMFGAQFFTGSVELSAAGTKALDALLDRPDSVEKIIAFLERYSSCREKEDPSEEKTLKEPNMAEIKETPGVTAEQLEKVNAELAATKADSRKLAAETAQSAVIAERQRVSAIRLAAFAGQEDLINKAVEEGLTVEQAMASFIGDQKLKNKTALEKFRKDSVPALGPNSDANQDADIEEVALDATDYDEIALTAKWEKSPALRSEFLQNKASFLAYCRAASKGQVRLEASKK